MPSVADDYAHIRKVVEAGPVLSLPPGRDLKWYDVRAERTGIPADVRRAAREFLQAQAAAGQLALGDDLGFVILHRVGGDYLLLVCTWRHDNELWETVYFSPAAAAKAGRFELVPRDAQHKPTYCVWEMAAVLHEQQAWIRYLLSARDAAAQRAYLADQAGRVLI